jgi:hypothetical protein
MLLAIGWGRPIEKRAYGLVRPRYHALVRAGLERLCAAKAERRSSRDHPLKLHPPPMQVLDAPSGFANPR